MCGPIEWILRRGEQEGTNFARKIAILPEKLPFCRKKCHFSSCTGSEGVICMSHAFFPTCFRTHLKKSFLCYFKPQKPLEMTIKAHSAVLNVHFYHHLHLPTSFLGYRTQFKLIKFNSVLIVPNSLKKPHFEPQKPLEMAMKPHSAVLNVKFYYYS